MKERTTRKLLSIIIGGLLIATLGHFYGQNIALSVIGGWIFYLVIKN